MLAKVTIRTKLAAISLIVIGGITLMGAIAAWQQRDRMFVDRVAKIKEIAEAGKSLIAGFATTAASGAMSKEEAQSQALKAIRSLGVCLSSAIPSLIGKEMINAKDPNGVPFVRDMISVAKASQAEVKALATQTARATDEIASQVETVQKAVSQSAAEVGEIENLIANNNAITAAIAAAVQQQETATSEIARTVQETADRSSLVAREMNDLAGLTQDMQAVANEVGVAASGIRSDIGELDGAVVAFLADLRSNAAA